MQSKATTIEATHFKDPSVLSNDVNVLLETLQKIQRVVEIYFENERVKEKKLKAN